MSILRLSPTAQNSYNSVDILKEKDLAGFEGSIRRSKDVLWTSWNEMGQIPIWKLEVYGFICPFWPVAGSYIFYSPVKLPLDVFSSAEILGFVAGYIFILGSFSLFPVLRFCNS